MTENEQRYYHIMNTSVSLKSSIPDFVYGTRILDVGSGGGVMLDLLEKRYPEKVIIGTDVSPIALELLREKKTTEKHNWVIDKHNFLDNNYPVKVDTIIFSAILHEIFSYTETNGRKFNISSVVKALDNAYSSLSPHGRIIIRDGIKLKDRQITINLVNEKEGLQFFHNFQRDFEGKLDNNVQIEGNKITGNINYLKEFILKYNWGEKSYPREIQEQFGYLEIDSYVDLLKGLGFNVLLAKAHFEDGYKPFFEKLVSGIQMDSENFSTNCFIVAERPR